MQEFAFEIGIEVEDGALVVTVSFALQAARVNPASTFSDISTSVHGLLTNSSDQFESILSSFGSSFDSVGGLFTSITDRIALSLDANLNAEVKLVADLDVKFFTPGIESFTTMNEMSMALIAEIITVPFNVIVSGYEIQVVPSVFQLRMSAENTALPFDVVESPLAFGDFTFSGDFEGIISIAMEDIPTDIVFKAYSPNLLESDSLDFGVGLDIDLSPLQQSEYMRRSLCIRYIYDSDYW